MIIPPQRNETEELLSSLDLKSISAQRILIFALVERIDRIAIVIASIWRVSEGKHALLNAKFIPAEIEKTNPSLSSLHFYRLRDIELYDFRRIGEFRKIIKKKNEINFYRISSYIFNFEGV